MARIDPSAAGSPAPISPLTSGPAPTPTPAPAAKPKKPSKKAPAPLAPPSESGWWVGKKPFHFQGTLYQPGHPVPPEVHQGLDPAYREHLLQSGWFIGDRDAAGKLFHKTVQDASEQPQPLIDESLLRSQKLWDYQTIGPVRSETILARLSQAKNPEEQKALVHDLAKEVGLDLTPYRTKDSMYNTTDISLTGVGKLLQAVTRTDTDIHEVVRHLDESTANTLIVGHALVNLHADAQAQLRHGEETGGQTGKAWYEDDVDAMEAGIHHMVMMDPKLAGLRPKIGAIDETGRHVGRHDPLSNPTMGLFKVLVAITSGGNKPDDNLRWAVKIMEQALRHPRVLAGESPFLHLPERNVESINPATGEPRRFMGRPGIDVTGKKLKNLVARFGEAGALRWLLEDHSGHEIRHFGGGQLPDGVNAVYPGSFIFGQKLGPFTQNLFRRSTELTADRWFVRTWRRIMGDLTGTTRKKGKVQEEVIDTPNPRMKRLMGIASRRVAASLGLSVSSLQAVLWYYEKRLWRAAGIASPEESYADAVEKEIQRRGLPAFRRPRRTPDSVGTDAVAPSAGQVALHRRRGATPVRSRPGSPSRYAAPVQAPGKGLIAWSPNVDENLDFGAAWKRMRSANHKSFSEIADHVLKTVGLKDYKTHSAVGDWSDGAEDSFAHVFSGPQDPAKIDYAASWIGLLANQKGIVAFHANDEGPDRLFSITLKGTDATQVRKGLDAVGLTYRTIVPTRDGFHVLIFDQGGGSAPAVEKFAEATNATVLETAGRGSIVGAGTRSEARHAFRQRIDQYEAKPNSSRYRPPVRGAAAPSRPSSVYSLSRRRDGSRSPIRYAHVRAPAGGIVVRGVFYPGGKFIPSSELEKASPEERQELEARLGGGQSAAQPPAESGSPAPDPVSSRLQALTQAAASVPPAIAQKAKALIQARYQKLVERYGPKGAATVLVATALLTPVPVPGTSLLPVALAEGIKLAKAALSRRVQPARARRRGQPARYSSFSSERERTRVGFQQALQENPFDHNARLMYADFLEEGDETDMAERMRTMGDRWEGLSDRSRELVNTYLKSADDYLNDKGYYVGNRQEVPHSERIYRLIRHHGLVHEHWLKADHPDSEHQAHAHGWLHDHFASLEPKTKTENILKLSRPEQEAQSGPTTSESGFPHKSRSVAASVPSDTTSDWTPEMTTRFFKESDRLEPNWRDRVHRVNKPRAVTPYVQAGGSFGLSHKVDWSKYDHDATVAAHTQRYRDVLLHPDSHLTRLHQQRYDQSLSGLLSRLPPVAMARLHAHNRDYTFGKDHRDLGRQIAEHGHQLDLEPDETIGGLFHPDTGLYLDGDIDMGDDRSHVGGQAEGIHAHEIGHAIDGTMANRLSSTGHWRRAWDVELSEGALSNYATESPHEGFAEFVQALYASKLKPEQLERQFPLVSYLFKEWGLWPGSPHPNAQAASARPLQPARPGPERSPRRRR